MLVRRPSCSSLTVKWSLPNKKVQHPGIAAAGGTSMCSLGPVASNCALFNPVPKCNQVWLVLVVASTVLSLLLPVTSTSLSLFSRSQLKKEKFPQVLVEVKLKIACWQRNGQQVYSLNRSRTSSNLVLLGLFSQTDWPPRGSWIIKLSPCGNCPAKLFSFEHSYFSAPIGKASELVICFLEKTSLLDLDCTRFAFTQICSALINSLIRCYYDDIASTDAISERLRDVCPNLFSRDDAVSTKVRNR